MKSTLNKQTTSNEMELYKRAFFVFLVIFLVGSACVIISDRGNFTPVKWWLCAYVVFEFLRAIIKVCYEKMADGSKTKRLLWYVNSFAILLWIILIIIGTILIYQRRESTFLWKYVYVIIYVSWFVIIAMTTLNIFMCITIVCCCGSMGFRRGEREFVSSMEKDFPVRPYTDFISKYNDQSCAICLEDFY